MTDRSIVDNFDELSRLAREAPEAFEKWRQQLLDEHIGALSAERQERLRRLQWRIEQENRRSDSELGRCVRLSSMMWESLGKLQDSVEQICSIYEGRGKAGDFDASANKSSGKSAGKSNGPVVLPFEKKAG